MSLKDVNPVNAKRPKRVAIVISSPTVASNTGWPVGFWWSELAHPYYRLREQGYEMEIFSTEGGKCEADAMSDARGPSGYSAGDLISMGFIATTKLAARIESTKKVTDLQVDDFDAILCAGGQGPMYTYEKSIDLQRKFSQFYESGKGWCERWGNEFPASLKPRVFQLRSSGHFSNISLTVGPPCGCM
jgi:putative intracellular protease/amidase